MTAQNEIPELDISGYEHYRLAEKLLSQMNGKRPVAVDVIVRLAQVHATLAVADALADIMAVLRP